jgi:hypothetical protein
MKKLNLIRLVTVATLIINLSPCYGGNNNDSKKLSREEMSKALANYGDFFVPPRGNGLVAVAKDGKWGCIDKNGKEVTPCIYDRIHHDDDDIWVANIEGLVAVKKEWGYIDTLGKEVIPHIYDYANVNAHVSDFGELAVVGKDGKWGYIDKSGKEIVPCVLNAVYSFRGKFAGGFALVEYNEQGGLVDTDGYFVGKGVVINLHTGV